MIAQSVRNNTLTLYFRMFLSIDRISSFLNLEKFFQQTLFFRMVLAARAPKRRFSKGSSKSTESSTRIALP